MTVAWNGDIKEFDGVRFEAHPLPRRMTNGCFHEKVTSCLMGVASGGTKKIEFKLKVSPDGNTVTGVDSTVCGVVKVSPISCLYCCGCGPLAFVMPGTIHEREGGSIKWIGNGQVCAGGCCPWVTNEGDWITTSYNTDGSDRNKFGTLVAGDNFMWPSCLHGKPVLVVTQKDVGPPLLFMNRT